MSPLRERVASDGVADLFGHLAGKRILILMQKVSFWSTSILHVVSLTMIATIYCITEPKVGVFAVKSIFISDIY